MKSFRTCCKERAGHERGGRRRRCCAAGSNVEPTATNDWFTLSVLITELVPALGAGTSGQQAQRTQIAPPRQPLRRRGARCCGGCRRSTRTRLPQGTRRWRKWRKRRGERRRSDSGSRKRKLPRRQSGSGSRKRRRQRGGTRASARRSSGRRAVQNKQCWFSTKRGAHDVRIEPLEAQLTCLLGLESR